jgi:antitoxin (DNA-binding transcriptional repressor) of toxin-antitoxin stability system
VKTVTSREVQKNFGAIADFVSSGESVRVTKYGRPGFFIVPENDETAEMMRKLAGRRMVTRLQSLKPTSAALALSQDDINQLVDDCFKP